MSIGLLISMMGSMSIGMILSMNIISYYYLCRC